MLADLHAVDPDAVGLGDLRRPGSYLDRQLRRWHRQVHESACPTCPRWTPHTRGWCGGPRRSPPSEVRIAHGDFRLGNLAVGPDGRVRAVFDWELATLGDPLADLGWLIASWGRPGDEVPPTIAGPSLVDGYAERDELVARYAQRSGRDVVRSRLLRGLRALALGVHRRGRLQPVRRRRDGRGGGGPGSARLESLQTQAKAALAALDE